jgi:hypothetical protein
VGDPTATQGVAVPEEGELDEKGDNQEDPEPAKPAATVGGSHRAMRADFRTGNCICGVGHDVMNERVPGNGTTSGIM